MANWDKIKSRGRVDDRRAATASAVGKISLTGVLLFMGVTYLMGGNPLDVLTQVDIQDIASEQTAVDTTEFAGEDSYEVFVSTVLGSNNATWEKIFAANNRQYTEPEIVLFRNQTTSGCGGARSAIGPHYCPLDKTIYLDETFFDELERRFGARGGDVAEAYVIAHEVGHHVQNLLGTISKSRRTNEDSIKTELQADCFAGLWAHTIKNFGVLEANEIKEAIDAAAAVGDDRIQEKMQGSINPESWTHGSSEERVKAFTTGYNSGQLGGCNY